MAAELVHAVAASEEIRPRWCDSCSTSEGYEADIYAMLPSGLQKIATFTGCERCNASGVLVCHYCGETREDGGAFWQHVRDTHAAGR